jgi:transposase InsO family protein
MAYYIENYYNPLHRHSALEYLTPDEFKAIAFNQTRARTLVSVDR